MVRATLLGYKPSKIGSLLIVESRLVGESGSDDRAANAVVVAP